MELNLKITKTTKDKYHKSKKTKEIKNKTTDEN